jgi:hypothetical protein
MVLGIIISLGGNAHVVLILHTVFKVVGYVDEGANHVLQVTGHVNGS